MKILLVLSPMMQAKNHTLSSSDTQMPIGLCYLAAVLEKEGHSVKILDGQLSQNTEQDLQNLLNKEVFDVIGIGAVTAASLNAVKLAKIAKQVQPQTVTLLGSIHATVIGPSVLQEMPDIDIAVFNEAEITILELMEYLQGKKKLESIDGIAFRKNGNIIKTNPRNFVEDLDSLPYPAYHLIDIEKYTPPPGLFFKLPIIAMMSSRGCVYRCNFCADRIISRGHYRARKPKAVVDEMEYWQKKYGAKEIKFIDSTFTIGRERIVEFCNELLKRDLGILWRCASRVDREDFELLKLMKKAGCCSISFGIESGDNEILKRMNKNITVEQIKQTVKWSKQAGLETKGFFILNYPGETIETTEKTIALSRELGLEFAGFNFAYPVIGSQMNEEVEKNYRIEPEYWNNPSAPIGNQIYFYQDKLPVDYLKKAYRRAVLGFYFNPKTMLKNIKKIRSFSILKSYLRGVWRLLFKLSAN